VERCGRGLCVQGPCGKRVLCVFHRSGTIHRLLRIIEAPRGSNSTVHDAVGTTIATRGDPEHPVAIAADHEFRFGPRRVSGSHIVGPFRVSLCAQ
jgi:hypothetical protein